MIISRTTIDNVQYQDSYQCIQTSRPNHTKIPQKDLSPQPQRQKENKSTSLVPNYYARQLEVSERPHSPKYACDTLNDSSNRPADRKNCPIRELKWLASHSKSILSGPTPLNRTILSWDIPLYDQWNHREWNYPRSTADHPLIWFINGWIEFPLGIMFQRNGFCH